MAASPDEPCNGSSHDSITCEDLKKPANPILTGVGFLDHMLDQFNSHAQIGLSVTLANISMEDRNCLSETDQVALMNRVGALVGNALKSLLTESTSKGTKSHFGCPLDEALVVCNLKRNDEPAGLDYQLAPYGKYPRSGRSHIGRMQTAPLQHFWQAVADATGLSISLTKLRGDNAHHIVEASFKAFCRAFRNLLDGVDTLSESDTLEALYGEASENHKASVALQRVGSATRKTKETSIETTVRFDGGVTGVAVSTGVQTLDSFLATFAKSAGISLQVACAGDLWIDEHHTSEDVSIAIGQVLLQAAGNKAGLNRMWTARSAGITAVVDLSNRPCLVQGLQLEERETDKVGDLTLEMFDHVLDSLTVNARMTVHLVQEGDMELNDIVTATATALGQALKYCMIVDGRRAGATASSKGTLSV